MTQRPNLAAILDWSLKHLGLVSPCGLDFSQHGGWVLRGISRGNFRRVVIPREPGRSSLTFYELTSESTLYHSCYALLSQTATRLSRFNRKETYTPPFNGGNIKELEGHIKNAYLARLFCMAYTIYSHTHTHTHTHAHIFKLLCVTTPCGLEDLSSLIKDQPQAPSSGSRVLTTGPPWNSPSNFKNKNKTRSCILY